MADEVSQLLADVPFTIENDDEGYGLSISNMFMLGGKNSGVPPYWSKARDRWVVEFLRQSDPLKISIKTFISKANTIPLHVRPRDPSVAAHNEMAELLHTALMKNSGLFKGFKHVFQQFIFDYLTQDNGAFALILGGGPADGPIMGAASGLLHLESARCDRTSSPEFPIIYHHRVDGKRYKIHYTRLIDMVSLPSTDDDHNGVGMSPTSLCLDAAQELLNISVFLQEKLGSRPARQILYAKEGATIDQLNSILQHWVIKMDNEGMSRFAKTVVAAPKMPGQKLELATLDLSSVPDGFNRQEDTVLAMAIVAAAFGLDLRDVAHSFGISGQTRSDAEVQDRKGRGKGVGEFIEAFAERLTDRFLPDYLVASFDNLDDSQDEQVANIRSLKSTARTKDLMAGALSVRVVHQQMLREGELTQLEFEDIELEDGRLPDGNSILSLFYSTDPLYKKLLALPGLSDPLAKDNDPFGAVDAIQDGLIAAWQEYEAVTGQKQRRKIRHAIVALEFLQNQYQEAADVETQMQQQMDQQQAKLEAKGEGKTGAGGSVAMGVGKTPALPFGQTGKLAAKKELSLTRTGKPILIRSTILGKKPLTQPLSASTPPSPLGVDS